MTSDETVMVEGDILNDPGKIREENNAKSLNKTNSRKRGKKSKCYGNNNCDYGETEKNNNDSSKTDDELRYKRKIIQEIIDSIFEDVMKDLRTKTHEETRDEDEDTQFKLDEDEDEEKAKKESNRKTKIFIENEYFSSDDDEFFNNASKRESLYSLEEHDEDPDDHEYQSTNPYLPIRTVKSAKALNEAVVKRHKSEIPVRSKSFKGSILDAVFKRKSKPDSGDVKEVKTKKRPEVGLKYSQSMSAVNVGEKSTNLSRTPSLRKKLTNFLNKDAPNLLKRSFSFKDLSKRRVKDKSRDKLSEMKHLEWASSLQSLVETDIGISYKDLSFINYDVQNEISYNYNGKKVAPKSAPIKILQRAQSLHENGSSPINRKPNLSRGTSFPRHYQSTTDLSECAALSLPSLHHLHQENVDITSESFSRSQKYHKRPPSICSDDGNKSRPIGNGSFKTAGSGCAKLKRHNACRQKTRDVISPHGDPKNNQEGDTVRSKSLNHLDEIEMRQSAEPTTDSALKDSKSEPDCAKTLLAPPARTIPTPEPPASSSDSTTYHPSRKLILSRSQKSSSECFSVNFEVGDESTWDNELFFPAVRGVTLNDSLSKLCELRNIDLTSCDAWLQDKGSNTNAWLPFSQDTACLVGKHVRITAKDVTSNKKYSGSIYGNHSRKPSTSNSKSRASSFFSSSVEDGNIPATSTPLPQDNRLSLQDPDSSKKQTKQRWSGFFSNTKDTKMELLVEQLNTYAKNGIPNCQIYPQGQCESIDALYKLEIDWREIIDYNDLTERLQQQQTALWELIKTEVAYIKTLKVVTDLFLACLKNLQSVNLLKEIDTEKLFSNITEILDANVLFWRNCIFPLVRDMRRFKQPPCIETMLQGFLKISETFQAYFRYCAEQSRCQHYCRENHTHNELFTAYLAWCETQKECNRLRLMDILVQPMQRLTKYGLLLKAILRNTDDDVERDNLNLMLKSVDDFVNSVNFSLKQKQDNERLKGIMARIESYDAVESKDDDLERLLKAYSQLDLNKPMIGCPLERKRHLLLEGDLKLKDSSTSKMEVHCFLLTDMLLVCKPSTKKGGATMRIIRQPYLVDRLVITELSRETPSLAAIYKNEFDLPIAAFILQNNDSKKLKSWKESIGKAQSLYLQAKQMNYMPEEALEADYSTEYNLEGDYHSLQLIPRSPLASSSRASRVSSLAHSHSGSVEMNDQSSVGSANQSRAVSMENENRTASISSDEGVQPLPPDKSPVAQKLSFKHRLFNKTPNTLSVQPYGNLGQSLPNLTLGSPNVGTLSLNLSQNTLSVPSTKTGSHLLSPTHRGVSYPPPSPTRGNLKRGLAISQNKNPPLLKTRHVTSTAGPSTSNQAPTSFDFDVPVIAGVSSSDDSCENFSRGQHRQAMLKRVRNDNKRYHTAGVVDEIKHNDTKDPSIHKRLSWNCSPQTSELEPVDQT